MKHLASASRMKHLASVLALALLTACATVPRAERDARPFDLLGRVLVSGSSGGAMTANLRWQHAAQDEIWLMTPTGQTLAHILDTGKDAVLTRADQKTYRAGSVESLTQQGLGWALPLSLLQYWVRGEPAPGFSATGVERDTSGRLTTLTQNGWRAALSYAADDAAARVRRIDVTGGGNEIRFVIDTWRNANEQ